ncbi:MAG: undecaprenyl-diphosphatase UppP [Acidobacteria bacterium]|nr:undecaprenyl-diphosphatase UppP [Acidobacteriota bacterium]
MNLIQAIILGVVQGLTEFIPVSSSAHLILAEKIMGLDRYMTPEQITAFTAVIQLGTLVAVIVYFFNDIMSIIVGFIGGNLVMMQSGRDGGTHNGAKLGWLIILGTLPVVIIGLSAKKIIEGAFTKNLYVIGISVIVWALLLLLAEFFSSRRRTISELGWKDALVVGIAQCFSLIPGSSRSGTTITGALAMGMTRETAARFSFLLSIPAIAGSGILEMKELFKIGGLQGIGITNLVVSTIVSAIVGYLSIAFLLSFLRKNSTLVFIVYRLIIGVVILWLVFAGRVTPQ